MKAKNIVLIAAAMVLIGTAGVSSPQAPVFTLSISPTSINFAAADPDAMPSIPADATVTATMRITGNGNNPWHLSFRANGDLIGFWFGIYTIDISTVSWTATPAPPFQNGTLVRNVYQLAASGTGNLNNYRGFINFSFQNLWTHRAENYSQTVTFTLSGV